MQTNLFFNSLIGDWAKGYDVAILVLKTPASLSPNVQIASLPPPDTSCPSGKKLIVSGWGKAIIWGLVDNDVNERYNRFLWAVKQECVDIDECTAYEGDKEAALCVGDLDEPRNGAYRGDSGGIS